MQIKARPEGTVGNVILEPRSRCGHMYWLAGSGETIQLEWSWWSRRSNADVFAAKLNVYIELSGFRAGRPGFNSQVRAPCYPTICSQSKIKYAGFI